MLRKLKNDKIAVGKIMPPANKRMNSRLFRKTCTDRLQKLLHDVCVMRHGNFMTNFYAAVVGVNFAD